MKYLIVVLFCLIVSNKIYAQGGKPTKQETMDWIVDKFKKYTNEVDTYNNYDNFHYVFVKAVDNKITLLIPNVGIKDGKKWTSEVTIDLSKLTNVTTVPEVESILNSIKIIGLNGVATDGGRDLSAIYIYRKYNDGPTISMIKFDAEPDLYNRFIKALTALAEMNRQSSTGEKY